MLARAGIISNSHSSTLTLCYVVCGGYSGVIDGCAFHKPAPVTDAIGIDVSVMGHDTLFYLVEGR